MENKISVLVTGFGPFGEHKINASSVAVKELEQMGFEDDIHLITKEIPVDYAKVSSLIPDLWQKYKPKVCVHVGVSAMANIVQMERCAQNSGYSAKDTSHQCPDGKYCMHDGPECLHTNICVEKILCDSLSENELCPCELEISCDAGRYLCEFIYYRSLFESLQPEHSGSSVLFIHVPKLDSPYSKTKLAQTLKYIVLEILKQQSCNMQKDGRLKVKCPINCNSQ